MIDFTHQLFEFVLSLYDFDQSKFDFIKLHFDLKLSMVDFNHRIYLPAKHISGLSDKNYRLIKHKSQANSLIYF